MPNNTTVNKVIINGVTKIDLTGDTATPADVAQGKTFHDASGTLQTGTASGGGGDSWSWMGKNPTKLDTLLNDKVFLKDTAFATWTPSTTATTIVASSNLTAQSIDLLSYDYAIYTVFHSHFEYNTVTTGNSRTLDQYYSYYQFLYSYHDSLSDMTDDVTSTTASTNSIITGGMFYIKASGVNAYYQTSSYGISITSVPSVSSLTTASVTPKKPEIKARGANAYSSTTNLQNVNQDTSYYEMKIELWRVDHQTTPYGALYKTDRDMWLNGGII